MRTRDRYFWLITLGGALFPLITWKWAHLIGGDNAWTEAFHWPLLLFNFVPFLVLGILALIAFTDSPHGWVRPVPAHTLAVASVGLIAANFLFKLWYVLVFAPLSLVAIGILAWLLCEDRVIRRYVSIALATSVALLALSKYFPSMAASFVFVPVSLIAMSALAWFLLRNHPDTPVGIIPKYVIMCASGALVWFSISLQMPYHMQLSSTGAITFIYYLPSAALCSAIGIIAGSLLGFMHVKIGTERRLVSHFLDGSLLLAGLFGLWVSSNHGRFNLPVAPGVVQSPDHGGIANAAIEKTRIIQAGELLGAITSIQYLKCGEDREPILTIVGRGGALRASRAGGIRSSIKFEKVAGDPFAINPGTGADCIYVEDAHGYQPVGVYNAEGKIVWKYGNEGFRSIDKERFMAGPTPQDIIPFDWMGDGMLDFLVPILEVGKYETLVISRDGKVLHRINLNFKHGAAADIDGDGKLELLHVGRIRKEKDNYLRVFNEKLKRVSKYPLPVITQKMKLIKWPDSWGTWHVIIEGREGEKNVGLIIDPKTGQTVKKHSLGMAVPVRFEAEENPYWVVMSYRQRRQVLSIYDSEENIIYEEILPSVAVIAVVPDGKSHTENLLVSECTEAECGVVWEYGFKRVTGSAEASAAADSWKKHSEDGKKAFEALRYKEAAVSFEAAIKAAEIIFPRDYRLADSLMRLAEVQTVTGQYLMASPLYHRALDVGKKVHGPNHPKTAEILNAAGFFHYVNNEYQKSKPFFERALAIREKSLKPDHPDIAETLHDLGELHKNLGNYDQSEKFHLRALAIRKQSLGVEHADYGESLSNIGVLFSAKRDMKNAEDYYLRGLKVREKALPGDHPDLAEVRSNLGAHYISQGRIDEAKPYVIKALSAKERVFGKNHLRVGFPLSTLMTIHYADKQYEEALKNARRALKIQQTECKKVPRDSFCGYRLLEWVNSIEAMLGKNRPAKAEK